MQMVRLNIIKRNNPAVTKPVEHVDLDEKIRRIREANKERERRFQEIEQDKKSALDAVSTKKESYKDNTSKAAKNKSHKGDIDIKSKPYQNSTMKGVQAAYHKKTTKGRGQRLLEMSHRPLKAEHFKSRTKNQWGIHEQNLPEKIALTNNCRTSIRERIKTKNKECGATVPNIGNEKTEMTNADISKSEDKLGCIPIDQCHEVSKENENLLQQTKGDQITKEFNDIKLQDDIHEETKVENHREDKEGNIAPCEMTDNFSDNVNPQEQDTMDKIEETSISHTHLQTETTTQKNDKPKITVNLKKTVSSSSFDESMAMLSPLDLPQNWGDLDFSDDDLPGVSIWKN